MAPCLCRKHSPPPHLLSRILVLFINWNQILEDAWLTFLALLSLLSFQHISPVLPKTKTNRGIWVSSGQSRSGLGERSVRKGTGKALGKRLEKPTPCFVPVLSWEPVRLAPLEP
jgi:hypothetical protein